MKTTRVKMIYHDTHRHHTGVALVSLPVQSSLHANAIAASASISNGGYLGVIGLMKRGSDFQAILLLSEVRKVIKSSQ